MIYAEAAYFDGDHCAHVAAFEDAKRLRRINDRNRAALRSHDRRQVRR